MIPTTNDIEVTNDPTGFADALQEIKDAHGPRGITVDNYGDEEYRKLGAKFFGTPDRKVLGLVKPSGEIASVASHPHGPWKKAAGPLLEKMKQHGGKFLDNFDTYLTPIYQKNGFEVVARVPFNPEFAPSGWNHPESPIKDSPDIVFMSLAQDVPRLKKLVQRLGAKDYGRISQILHAFYNRKAKMARESADTYTVYHYSPHLTGDSGTVDPKNFAKNPWTQAEKRALGTPRSFFYLNLKDREKNWFGKKTPLYTAEIPKEHVYDFDVDHLNIKQPGANLETMIRKVRGKGYKGIKYSGTGFPIIAMFHPVKVLKLSRSWLRQSAKDNQVQGWIEPDGTFHPLTHDAALPTDLAEKLGHKDTEGAHEKGLAHVAIAGSKELSIYHPKGAYTPAQLRKFKELARSRNFDAALTLKSGDRLKTVPVKLSRWSFDDHFHERLKSAAESGDAWNRDGIGWKATFDVGHHRGDDGVYRTKGTYTVNMKPRGEGWTLYFGRLGDNGVMEYDKTHTGHSHEVFHKVQTLLEGFNRRFQPKRVMFTSEGDEGDSRHRLYEALGKKWAKAVNGRYTKMDMGDGDLGHLITKLARSKAPEGGIVVNNQFYVGGKFLPRIFESIRKVRERRKRVSLARLPLPPGALGQETLTHDQVTQIEDNYGLKPKERLPRKVYPDGSIEAKVPDITKFFNTITKKEIGPSNLRRILKDPGTSDGVKLFHLVDHGAQSAVDFMEHSKSTGDEWYGSSVEALDNGVARLFPNWTPAKGRLFKMLTALTSFNTRPVQNVENALKALEAGHRANPDRPFEHIPMANFEELATVSHLPKPPKNIHARLRWYRKHDQGGDPAFMTAPVRVSPDGRVVGVETVSDGIKWTEPGFTKQNTKPGRIPLTDEQGNLRPKNWGSMRPASLLKFQAMIAKAGSYEKAAELLDQSHDRKAFKKVFDRTPPVPDDEVPGSYAFGPKFGTFYQNLSGDKSRITIDKWYSRTMSRLLGDIMDIPDNQKTRDLWKRAGELIAKRIGAQPADMQAVLWYYEQKLWRLFGARTPSEDFKMGIEQALRKRGYT